MSNQSSTIAWHTITLTKELIIILLSVWGMWILIALTADYGIRNNHLLIAHITGIVGFFIAIIGSIITINNIHENLGNMVANNGIRTDSSYLVIIIKMLSFYLAMLCLVGIGVWIAVENYSWY